LKSWEKSWRARLFLRHTT